nr:homeodomain-like protein [Tanacetum cinerariifolium]
MKQYMSKTRADYGSGVTRPKIDDNDHFELKGQFLKELRDNTFSGLDHEDANEHIEKIIEIIYPIHRIGITEQIFEPRQAIVPFPSRLYDECSDERKGSYGLKDLDAYSIGSTLRNDSLTKKEKDPRSLTLPCYINNVGFKNALVDLEASISVMPLSTNLNLGLELRRNQVDDLEPTIKEDEVVNKPMIDIVKASSGFIGGLDDYPSECDFDRRIHIDCAYNLQFSCMIGFEYVHANFLLSLPITVMSKKFYNTIMKEKIEFKRRNELGNFVNVPVFIGNFYVITDFAVVEDMAPYLDEGIGDVIVGEPFSRLRV